MSSNVMPQELLVEKIVAKVGNEIVLRSEVEVMYNEYKKRGLATSPDFKEKILEQLVQTSTLLAKAKRDKITIPIDRLDNELNYRINKLIKKVGSEAALADYYGQSVYSIKSEMKKQLENQFLVQEMGFKLSKDISVTPKEVIEFFYSLEENEIPYYQSEVEVRQIVKSPKISSSEKNTIISTLMDIKKRAENGEDFNELLKKYSQSSDLNDDNLEWHSFGELSAEYETVIITMKPGEVSVPIETKSGIYILQLLEKQKYKYCIRKILLIPSCDQLDINEAKQSLNELRLKILNKEITFEEAAYMFSDDDETATIGGLLTCSYNGGTKMAIDDLSTNLFNYLDQMQFVPGEVFEPVVYNISDNQQAVRIITIKEVVQPHKANLEQDYEKTCQILLDSLRGEAINKWFETVKEDFSIDISKDAF